MGRPHSRSGRFEEETNPLPPPEFEPQTFQLVLYFSITPRFLCSLSSWGLHTNIFVCSSGLPHVRSIGLYMSYSILLISISGVDNMNCE